jgi:hypothetical protein
MTIPLRHDLLLAGAILVTKETPIANSQVCLYS